MALERLPLSALPALRRGQVDARQDERRRQEVERARSVAAKLMRVVGTIFFQGVGEAQVQVNFPVAFIGTPAVSGGYEMYPNEVIVDHAVPTVNVGVLRWVRTELDDARQYYTGAVIGVVATGSAGQKFYAHWQMEGKAMRNPMASYGGS